MLLTLITGTAVFVASLPFYGMAMALIVHVVVRLARGGHTRHGFWKNVGVMIIVTLIAGAAHLTQIAQWAAALLLCGQASGFETAFYLSAQNYTALGYGDILLPEPWRLLGPLESINGLLCFGLSTAALFALMSRLIANRLRAEIGYKSEATVNRHLREVN